MNAATTRLLLAVAERIVPEVATQDASARERFLGIVTSALADRPPSLARQLALFLRVIRWAPVFRFGARFDRLDGPRRDAVLRWFERSPLGLLRKGFWGLRTIVLMGHYAQEEVAGRMGWAPVKNGNALLRG